MGGGAGIFIELELESFPLTVKKGKFVPARKPEIYSWSALGYMDGMNNIAPHLLKITSVDIEDLVGDPSKADLTGDWAYARKDGQNLKALVSGGQLRTRWPEWFPLTLSGNMHIDYYGDLQVSVTVRPRQKEVFGTWYKRVFEAYMKTPSEGVIKRRYGNIESWHAQYWDETVARYGAG